MILHRIAAIKRLALILCLAPWTEGKAAPVAAALGLSINSQGVLTRGGTPFRGIGVNYYDAFLRALRNPGDDSYKEGFAQLSAHGIPFARFSAGPFLVDDLRLYLTDKEAYFRRLDGVVQTAETSHVGLIASLFWSIAAVSEVVNEPRERWADASSQTRQLMRTYSQDVVSRYVNSPAIWGWEFSNELSLPVDMSPGSVPPERALSYKAFQSATLDFAKVVRKIDPQRILLTGNSLPRASAYHNANGRANTPDTQQEFAQILLRDNPGPFNPICIHASQGSLGHYFADHRVSYQELLNTCAEIGRRAGKPVYLEEFIPLPKASGLMATSEARQYFSAQLAAIEKSEIPMASVWVYDRKLIVDPSTLTFNNDKSYMLEMIAAVDRKLAASRF